MTRQTTPTSAKAWSYIAGEKGRNRVRVYEREPYGLWINYRTEEGRVRHCLGYSNRERAKREADTIAAQFGSAPVIPERAISLQTLLDMYVKEVSPRKSTGKQKHDARCAALFAKCFGGDRLPLTLAKRDFDRFVDDRRSGRLSVGKRKTGVANCMIGYDLRMLNAVFNWATVAGDGQGGVLLARNPFKGFPIPKETSPKRPVATDAIYQAMRRSAGTVSPQFEALLVLAHETGH